MKMLKHTRKRQKVYFIHFNGSFNPTIVHLFLLLSHIWWENISKYLNYYDLFQFEDKTEISLHYNALTLHFSITIIIELLYYTQMNRRVDFKFPSTSETINKWQRFRMKFELAICVNKFSTFRPNHFYHLQLKFV